ncbi:MAG: hypothetical protein ACI4KF_13040 [Huintestinicola sp.]
MKMRNTAIITAFLAVGMTIASVPVSADVIMEPEFPIEVEFGGDYTSVEVRNYNVTKKCDVYNHPGDLKSIFRMGPGDTCWINLEYIDDDGAKWGYIMSGSSQDPNVWISCGWVLMENLENMYDSIAFAEEHEYELVPYNDEYKDFTFKKEHILIWQYPVWDDDSDLLSEMIRLNADEMSLNNFFIEYTFTDPEGNMWLYSGIDLGGWICIGNEDKLYADVSERRGSSDESVTPAPDNDSDTAADGQIITEPDAVSVAPVSVEAENDKQDFILPIALAGSAVVVSCLLIFILKKRKKVS